MGLVDTDVTIETAAIALLSDDIAKLPELITLSRAVVHVIRQSLLFSLAVLAAAVGLTIVGLLSPVSGALLHVLSSISSHCQFSQSYSTDRLKTNGRRSDGGIDRLAIIC